MGEPIDPLLDLAKAADASTAAVVAPPPGTVVVDPRAQWMDFALRIGAMAREAHPTCKEHWDEPKLRALGAALADCAQRYGWKTTSALMTHPLVGLALAAGVLAWPFAAPYIMAWMEKQQPKAPTPPPGGKAA